VVFNAPLLKLNKMKREDLPSTIKSPITGDELELKDVSTHNDEELSVAQFFDSCTEWFDDCVMYRNDTTNETIYVSVERDIFG
jgi:hypothetical protein